MLTVGTASVSSNESNASSGVMSAISFLSKLPKSTTNFKGRSIDEFYEQAYTTRSVVKGTPSYINVLLSRIPYCIMFVSLGLANTGDSAEIGSMGFLLAHDGFREEIVQGHDGIIASMMPFGMLIGGLVSGPICDQIGRRIILLWGLFSNATFGVAMAFAQNPWQLCICRFVVGLGIGGVVSCVLALASEHTPPKNRGEYTNFVSSFWTIGSVYVALLAYMFFGKNDTSWRLYVLCNAAPSAAAFLLVYIFVPESARHLGLHGHYRNAAYVANKIAKAMGFEGSTLTMEEVQAHFPIEEIPPKIKYGVCFPCTDMCASFLILYTKKNRRNTIFIQLMWFTISFGTGLSLWMTRIFSELPMVTDEYRMALYYALASVPGVLFAGIVLDRVSRTRLLTFALVMTTVCAAVLAVLSEMQDTPAWAIVASACLFHSFLVVTWSVLSVITSESFSTSVRSTAMGLCAASGRVAAITCHLLLAPLLNSHAPYVLVVAGTCSFSVAIVISILSGIKSQTGVPLKDVEYGASFFDSLS